MIDIPLGKALVPVNNNFRCCTNCYFNGKNVRKCFFANSLNKKVACFSDERKDGKNVIFKPVDYPVEVKK